MAMQQFDCAHAQMREPAFVYHKQDTGAYIDFTDAGGDIKSHNIEVIGSGNTTLESSLSTIAKAKAVEPPSAEAALAWMSNLDTEFFMYMDNADDPDLNLHTYFPNFSHARVLITTRLRNARQQYGYGPSGVELAIELGSLSEDEAVDLLSKAAMTKKSVDLLPEDERVAIITLAQGLQYHALAIAQAGAYLHVSIRIRLVPIQISSSSYPPAGWKGRWSYLETQLRRVFPIYRHVPPPLRTSTPHGYNRRHFESAFQGLSLRNLDEPPIPGPYRDVDLDVLVSVHVFFSSFRTPASWDKGKFGSTIQQACSSIADITSTSALQNFSSTSTWQDISSVQIPRSASTPTPQVLAFTSQSTTNPTSQISSSFAVAL
ncbi:hypothetical protein BDV98DRAFT_595930 [Pterulicium gracile]|uniref:Uncharacterized protein n=1 Tax=Pterulicium gracile TaxID=1884261 RepID=A0A5C3Q856_9AGAR|nr:hypothetical protein BDV98DRAFT_595930 [Pterula gracilis]